MNPGCSTSGAGRAHRSLAIRRRRRGTAWTAEGRRGYAPAVREVLRRGTLVRLAAAIDAIDAAAKTGRPRDRSSATMLGAPWLPARDGRAWRRPWVGPGLPPHRSVRRR